MVIRKQKVIAPWKTVETDDITIQDKNQLSSDYGPDEMKKYLTQANTTEAFAHRKGSDDSRRWAMAKLTSFTQAGQ